MRSSIYGSGSISSSTHQQAEIQEQIRLENEALLDTLSNGVSRMKRAAGNLGREVNEQNQILRSLGSAFNSAQEGVGSSVSRLKSVVDRYGWKHTIYFSLGVVFFCYVAFRILF